MKCPECGTEENIVYFCRHQQMSDDDEDTNANCITMLCQDCGYNESFFLDDVLDDIFPEWSEIKQLEKRIAELEQQQNGLGSMFAGMMNNEPIPVDAEVIEESSSEESEPPHIDIEDTETELDGIPMLADGSDAFGENVCENCIPSFQEKESIVGVTETHDDNVISAQGDLKCTVS